MNTEEKAERETRPFALTEDSFPKIVVRKDIGKRWYDDAGILNITIAAYQTLSGLNRTILNERYPFFSMDVISAASVCKMQKHRLDSVPLHFLLDSI